MSDNIWDEVNEAYHKIENIIEWKGISMRAYFSDSKTDEHGCRSLTDDELLQIQSRMIDGVFANGSENPVLFYTR